MFLVSAQTHAQGQDKIYEDATSATPIGCPGKRRLESVLSLWAKLIEFEQVTRQARPGNPRAEDPKPMTKGFRRRPLWKGPMSSQSHPIGWVSALRAGSGRCTIGYNYVLIHLFPILTATQISRSLEVYPHQDECTCCCHNRCFLRNWPSANTAPVLERMEHCHGGHSEPS